ncbi:cytochrome P450 [Xylariaceae sp. FL0255]|nr:cytochrome P450 [Xylariaceae sp. FL0255]
MLLPRLIAWALGTLAGVLSHTCLFIHGEWHVQAPQLLIAHGTILALVVFVNVHDGLPILFGSYVLALLASITIYRAFFHRLAGFDGPWYARVSKLWHPWAARNCQNHLVLDALHKKYGDFVRTGPAEVTIFHPAVFVAMDGPQSSCIKSEWYDLLHPFKSLVTSRSKSVHAARRRQWSNCFSPKATAHHQAKIFSHILELDKSIEVLARTGQPAQMRNLCFWFAFDSMGDFTLSTSFNMLRDQQWHHIISRIQRAMSLLGPFGTVPWLVQLTFRLAPSVGHLRDWRETVAWARQQMLSRLFDRGSKEPIYDLAHFLVEGQEEGITEQDLSWLHGDSLLAIVAGSEPVAYTLVGIFRELSLHPDHIDKIHKELAGVDILSLGVESLQVLSKLPHLNAVINESLRLYPTLLTGGARKTSEKGVIVGDTFIPAHTTIISPRYTITRRDDCFARGSEFIPERWTTSPELIHNIAAFSPFGSGHHSCLGRSLALDTMRMVVALIVKKYDFQFAPGEDGSEVLANLRDQFTANPGNLALCFKLRERD